jgi:CO/xanthine dehydrogenase FAD-binding subunit
MTKTGSIQKVETKNGNQALCFDVAVLLEDVYTYADVPEILREALSGVVSWQQRNETNLARFLAGPSQFPAFVLALLACDAAVQTDNTEMDLNSYLSVKQSNKATALLLPIILPERKVAMAKVGMTPAGEGIVLAAAGVDLEGDIVKTARLALSGVWHGKQWMSAAADGLVGAALTDEVVQTVAQAVQEEVDPPADHLGSATYRRAMAGVLTRQVLLDCKQGSDNE